MSALLGHRCSLTALSIQADFDQATSTDDLQDTSVNDVGDVQTKHTEMSIQTDDVTVQTEAPSGDAQAQPVISLAHVRSCDRVSMVFSITLHCNQGTAR